LRWHGVLHRIEVVQVAEELVETMQRGQEVVAVAKVVLAELAGSASASVSGWIGAILRRRANSGYGLLRAPLPVDLANSANGSSSKSSLDSGILIPHT